MDDFATVVNFTEHPNDFFEKAVEGAAQIEVEVISRLYEATLHEPTTLPTADELGISQAELDILTGEHLTKRLLHGSKTPNTNMFTMDFIAHLLAPFRNPDVFAYSGFVETLNFQDFNFFAEMRLSSSLELMRARSSRISLLASRIFQAWCVTLEMLACQYYSWAKLREIRTMTCEENIFFSSNSSMISSFRVAIWQAQAISHQERFVVDFCQNADLDSLPCKLPFSAALFVDGSKVTVSVFLVVRYEIILFFFLFGLRFVSKKRKFGCRYKLRWIVFHPIDCMHSRDKLLRVLQVLLVCIYVFILWGQNDGPDC